MFDPTKHGFLQRTVKKLNLDYQIEPRILNKFVEHAKNIPTICRVKVEENNFKLDEPNIPVDRCDVTRRFVGFGRIGLKTLLRELHDKKESVRIEALTSIWELIKNPEHLYTMIKMRLVNRLGDLVVHPNVAIRERSLLVLSVISSTDDSKMCIVNSPFLLKNMKQCLDDSEIHVRFQVANVLKEVSSYWEAVLILTEYDFLPLILNKLSLESEVIIPIHLSTIKSLMYCKGKCLALHALQAFTIMHQYLKHENPKIISGALACLMELSSLKQGRVMANNLEFLIEIKNLLYHTNTEVHTNAAGLLMNVTLKLKVIVKATTLDDLLPRLIELAQSRSNTELQIYTIKTIENLTQSRKIRMLIQTTYNEQFSKIKVNPELREFKKQLESVLFWSP